MTIRSAYSMGRMCVLAAAIAAVPACGTQKTQHSSTELAPVHYNYIYLFANYELVMNITPDGAITARQQTGNTATDVSSATGQLTPEQKQELIQLFADWDELLPNYPADVTPIYQITYGDHRVVAGNNPAVPPRFKHAQLTLDKIARAILSPRRTTAPSQP